MGALLTLSYFCFTLLSWILLLRDPGAIAAIGQFYPAIGSTLLSWRLVLLHFGLNTWTSVFFALLALGSFAGYIFALRHPVSARSAVLFATAFSLIALFSYPVLSTDIFDYILSDRVAIQYHQNVWTTPPSAVVPASDSFYSLASWPTRVNPYGPVNQFFYSLAGRLSGNDLIISLLAHKLLVMIFVLAALAITYLILKKHFPSNLSRGIILVFLNPLFILETVGSGHNDILMTFFLLVAIYFWAEKNLFLAGLFLAVSAQVKFIPLLLFPFLFASLRKSPAKIGQFSAGFLIINLLAILYLGPALGPFIQRIIIGNQVYWQSLAQLVHQVAPDERNLFTLGFLITFGYQFYTVFAGKKNPLVAFVTTLFLYLALFTSVYWNWYILWLLPLLPFIPRNHLSYGVLLFSATALLSYPLYWLSLRFAPANIWLTVVIYLFLVLPPLLVFSYGKFNSKTQT